LTPLPIHLRISAARRVDWAVVIFSDESRGMVLLRDFLFMARPNISS
jgi:hypothetical protein